MKFFISKNISFTLMFLLIGAYNSAAEDSGACGLPPRVDDENLQGEISGKAKFITSFLGGAEAGGQIKIARTDIFKQAPDGLKHAADRYLLYMTCVFLMKDEGLPTKEKIQQLIFVRSSFMEDQ